MARLLSILGFHRDISHRVHLIDEVRGLSILLMVIYHAFFDLVILFGVNIPAFSSTLVRYILVPFFAGSFVFISGAACLYSHNNLKRGAICFGFGMVFTLFTYFFMPGDFIAFGILHFLGCAMMLYPLFKGICNRLSPLLGVLIGLFLFFLCYHLPDGYLGFRGIISVSLPAFVYDLGFLFWLGFPASSFFSMDYFPILPWIFLFYSGSCFGRLLKENRAPKWFYQMHLPVLAAIGRHTFLIYLLHQPIIYGLLSIIFFMVSHN